MKNMTPEERAQWEERMRGRGGDPTAFAGGGRGGGRSGTPGAAPGAPRPASPQSSAEATTIDQLFGALPTTESRGRAWLHVGGQLKAVQLRLGITDGTYTELISGELQAGQELVTSVTAPQTAAGAAARSPLMPGGPGGGRGPGGMPGGGGGRR